MPERPVKIPITAIEIVSPKKSAIMPVITAPKAYPKPLDSLKMLYSQFQCNPRHHYGGYWQNKQTPLSFNMILIIWKIIKLQGT